MTALNVVIGPDHVSVFTDRAFLSTTGKVRRFASKTTTLCGCVVAARGEARALPMLVRLLPFAGASFAEFRQAAGNGTLRRLCRLEALTGGWPLILPFDLVVAGWSDGDPRAFVIFNHGRHGMDAWSPVDVPAALLMPPVSVPEGEDPEAGMPSILDAQRLHLEPSFLIPGGRSTVGGSADRTRITAQGITTTEIRRWSEDRVGQAIGGHHAAPRQAWRRITVGIFLPFLALVGFHLPALVRVGLAYEGIQSSSIETTSGTFEVFDRPDLGRFLTVASLRTAVAGLPPSSAHDQAGAAWLGSHRRECTLKSTKAILPSEVEHEYVCW